MSNISTRCPGCRSPVAVEVKAAATLNADDLKNLRWFEADGPGQAWGATGILFYLGDEPLSFGDGLFTLPLSIFWAWSNPRP